MKSVLSLLFVSITFFGYSTPAEKIIFHSQASQDEFAYTILYNVLGKQSMGFYLEIGAAYPIFANNSYIFEKNLDWFGVSIEMSSDYEKSWYDSRKNPLLIADATQVDYDSLLTAFPPVIDYLSLDIDDCYDIVLKKLPLKNHLFTVITIEHDFYQFGDIYRASERSILTSMGYYLLCPDVTHPRVGSFEDWWIHPSVFPPEIFTVLTSLDLKFKDHQEIIRILKDRFP